MQGGIAPKWNELDRTAKIFSTIGVVLGSWGFPLFALVLTQSQSGIFGEGEYGIGAAFLALIPVSVLMVACGLSLWFLKSTRTRRLSLSVLILVAAIVPVFLTVGYAIHLRYPCWPHHPIGFCS
jgi:uncharacterized protein (DUF486 family)